MQWYRRSSNRWHPCVTSPIPNRTATSRARNQWTRTESLINNSPNRFTQRFTISTSLSLNTLSPFPLSMLVITKHHIRSGHSIGTASESCRRQVLLRWPWGAGSCFRPAGLRTAWRYLHIGSSRCIGWGNLASGREWAQWATSCSDYSVRWAFHTLLLQRSQAQA